MAVTFQSKYMFMVFLHLINVRCMFTNHGKEGVVMRSLIVSNAQEHTALHWPKGIVTYYLDHLTYDYYIAHRVRMAMNVMESASCVRFEPALVKPAGNMTWINFTNPQKERKCVHEPIYKKDGEIVVTMGFDCLKEHEILHTLLHAIGFKDEVTHPQRDQYIRVMWNNIQPEYRHLFRAQSSDEKTPQLLVEYDPLSVMHFHDRAFSVNGHATVMPLVPGLLISPSKDLSQLDKMRLRLLFDHECNKRKVGDMIDTCKMLISNSERPNDSKNVTDSKSEEKQSEAKETNKDTNGVHKTDEDKEVHEVIDIDKTYSSKEFTDRKETKETRGDNEIAETENKTELSGIENQYDLNEQHPDNKLNRLMSIKLLDQVNHKKESAESISKQENEYVQESDD